MKKIITVTTDQKIFQNKFSFYLIEKAALT